MPDAAHRVGGLTGMVAEAALTRGQAIIVSVAVCAKRLGVRPVSVSAAAVDVNGKLADNGAGAPGKYSIFPSKIHDPPN